MKPVRRDLVIEQGTTWTSSFLLRVDGQPLLDSTWTATAQVRDRKTSTDVLHAWSTAAGSIAITDEGHLTLTVAANVSTAWAWRYGVYDLEVSKGATTYRPIEGSVTVNAQVTRP